MPTRSKHQMDESSCSACPGFSRKSRTGSGASFAERSRTRRNSTMSGPAAYYKENPIQVNAYLRQSRSGRRRCATHRRGSECLAQSSEPIRRADFGLVAADYVRALLILKLKELFRATQYVMAG